MPVIFSESFEDAAVGATVTAANTAFTTVEPPNAGGPLVFGDAWAVGGSQSCVSAADNFSNGGGNAFAALGARSAVTLSAWHRLAYVVDSGGFSRVDLLSALADTVITSRFSLWAYDPVTLLGLPGPTLYFHGVVGGADVWQEVMPLDPVETFQSRITVTPTELVGEIIAEDGSLFWSAAHSGAFPATDELQVRLSVGSIMHDFVTSTDMVQAEVPTASVVRQRPRDDGRGLSSAPRIYPPPKSRRIVGGYQ